MDDMDEDYKTVILSRRLKTQIGEQSRKERLKAMNDIDEDYRNVILHMPSMDERSERPDTEIEDWCASNPQRINNNPQKLRDVSKEGNVGVSGTSNTIEKVGRQNNEETEDEDEETETNSDWIDNMDKRDDGPSNQKSDLGKTWMTENDSDSDVQAESFKKRKIQDHRKLKNVVEGEYVRAIETTAVAEKDGGQNNHENNNVESDSDKNMIGDEFQHPVVLSEFRKQLRNILKKPYSREEYDGLRKAVKAQMTEESGGDLGSRSTKSRGKCYLHHHHDLQQMLKDNGNDRRKNLNLLRGFFFWLEHVKMEGAFKPWKDPESLTVKQECRCCDACFRIIK